MAPLHPDGRVVCRRAHRSGARVPLLRLANRTPPPRGVLRQCAASRSPKSATRLLSGRLRRVCMCMDGNRMVARSRPAPSTGPALRSVSPRALPAASRRSRGVLRRYAAVSIAEVGHSAALRLPAARACVCAWTENGRPRGLLRGLALRGRDHGQRPRCRAHCFLDIWRADTPVISRRGRVCVAVRATPRGAQYYKRASARADAARDHGKESRPRTCRDGCAAHRVQTSEQTPRLWRPNLRDEETRRVERTPHRCRIDGATHRPGAIQDLAVSARCRSSLPRRPGCPPPVGIEAQDGRPKKYSIGRCSVLPAEQGGNLDRT